MHKRKLAPIALALALLFIFAACGTAQGQATSGQASQTAGSVPPDTAAPAEPLQVDGGAIQGVMLDDTGVWAYKGIPYAAPPVGDLRWEPPQPVIPWSGVLECFSFGANPVQYRDLPRDEFGEEFGIDLALGSSEDCLTLNVWTLDGADSVPRPVIVFIPGGGFINGGSSCPIYDGEALAKKGVVFVSVNYRLSALGFLAHAELTAESAEGVSGNYALQDQIAALEWVRDNIAAFGGDPANVTVMGQSAGSRAVHSLVASPMAAGLFSKAVTASANEAGVQPATLQEYEQACEEIFQGIPLEELRAMDAAELNATFGRNAKLNIDGKWLVESATQAYATGSQNHVVMMTGMVNGDVGPYEGLGEYSAYLDIEESEVLTADTYTQLLSAVFGQLAGACLTAYPASDETALSQWEAINHDSALAKLQYLAGLRAIGNDETYIYYMSHPYPKDEAAQVTEHTDDLAYWFNNLAEVRQAYLTSYDYALAEQMSDYLVSFAAQGKPNSDGNESWPAYDNTGGYLHLGEEVTYSSLTDEKYAFWMEYYESQFGF